MHFQNRQAQNIRPRLHLFLVLSTCDKLDEMHLNNRVKKSLRLHSTQQKNM